MKKSVDQYLRDETDLNSADKNNVHYHVLTRLAARLAVKRKPTVEDIAKIDRARICKGEIEVAFNDVRPIYEELGGDSRIAKGPDFASRVRDIPSTENACAVALTAEAPLGGSTYFPVSEG